MTEVSLAIEIASGVVVERPIHIRRILTGARMAHAEIAIRVGEGGDARVVETLEMLGGDAAAGFDACLCRADVEAGAVLRRSVVAAPGASVVAWSMFAATVAAAGRLEQSSVTTGSRYSRHETLVQFAGAEASAQIDSAAMAAGDRHADFTTRVEHLAPECVVRQRHKGVATGKGRVVFQGKFFVAREGQKTDADMQAKALLLSEGAQANHKPELEIYADDVECAQGSTCGALDDEALFYLRQRGLDEAAARALLIEAFVGEVVDEMDGAAAPAAREMLDRWLAEGGE